MRQTFKVITASLVGLLFSTLGIISHASAMPAGMHGSMEHKTVTSVNCATVCLSAPSGKEREVPAYNEDDDEPEPRRGVPHLVEFDPFAEPEKQPRTSTHDETILKPPDLVTLFANFRI